MQSSYEIYCTISRSLHTIARQSSETESCYSYVLILHFRFSEAIAIGQRFSICNRHERNFSLSISLLRSDIIDSAVDTRAHWTGNEWETAAPKRNEMNNNNQTASCIEVRNT